LDRIQQLGRGGGTVLFVSHNMGIVASLCQRAIVLDQGRVIAQGPAREQVRNYITMLNQRASSDLASRTDRGGNGALRVQSIRLLGLGGRPVENVLAGEPLTIRFDYRAPGPVSNVEVHAWVCNDQGNNVTMLSSRLTGDLFELLPPEGSIACEVPEVALAPGPYLLNFRVNVGLDHADEVQAAVRLDVEPGPFFATGRTPGSHQGSVLTRHRWHLAE
jgi:lipopolysaccharide transport system ATP-binding protein